MGVDESTSTKILRITTLKLVHCFKRHDKTLFNLVLGHLAHFILPQYFLLLLLFSILFCCILICMCACWWWWKFYYYFSLKFLWGQSLKQRFEHIIYKSQAGLDIEHPCFLYWKLKSTKSLMSKTTWENPFFSLLLCLDMSCVFVFSIFDLWI